MCELLTDREIKTRITKLPSLSDKFEFAVKHFLKRERSGDLYILADFYIFCIEILNIEKLDYFKARKRIQYRLRKMEAKGVIKSTRMGSGFLGKTDFGMTSLNTYSLPD